MVPSGAARRARPEQPGVTSVGEGMGNHTGARCVVRAVVKCGSPSAAAAEGQERADGSGRVLTREVGAVTWTCCKSLSNMDLQRFQKLEPNGAIIPTKGWRLGVAG